MPADKNLFPYDLAVAAIFKDEARYLKEWLDYHLLAGVDHFYLYNNDSSDNFAEVLAPYVAANLVTLTNFPGKAMQVPAYIDALNRFRFSCRYMAFIDLDEFIFPKANCSIVEVVDEIFLRDKNAAGLGINVQTFGSNGQETADYSRGVLERFTRRASSDWVISKENDFNIGNIYIKSIVNPRLVDYYFSPHYAIYFDGLKSINSDGAEIYRAGNHPICADKIVINHYYCKSLEEFADKVNRGSACRKFNHKKMSFFHLHDRNDVFDADILKYRAVRAENFSVESKEQRRLRVEKTLTEILTQCSPFDVSSEFFAGKMEIFLTCRALAEEFNIKIGARSAEEYALVWIYQCLTTDVIKYSALQLFMSDLPNILARPFPLCKKILQLTQNQIIPAMCEELKFNFGFKQFTEFNYIQRLLSLIKRFSEEFYERKKSVPV